MVSLEAVIGLEIHVQLKTQSKLFCSCATSFGEKPNNNVCEVCSGFPGALPRINAQAVKLAAIAGMALNCPINLYSIFSRKNYFYPDLPNGYQTSQFEPPVCGMGWFDVTTQGKTRRIGITRIHMEDDAGKCVHDSSGKTFVDLNRAGTPLVEIVTEPDFRSAEEASTFMKSVHSLLVYLGVTDGNMEEGNMRCDANVSLRPVGSSELNTRTEIKNLNSFRNIQRAIESEIERQTNCYEDGEEIVQETRLFDADRQTTRTMRTKEDAHDYRYFPNPDLPPVVITESQLSEWKASMPELPSVRRMRFVDDFGISEEDATVLTADKATADYFEDAVALCKKPKRVAGLMRAELLRECEQANISIHETKVTPTLLAELARIIEEGQISQRIAHDIFPDIFASGESPEKYTKERGLVQVSDTGALETIVAEVMTEFPNEVHECKSGKIKIMSFLVGQVMKKSKGKANPSMVSEMLKQKLGIE